MNNIIFKIRQFMQGRNGIDKLSIFILVIYMIIAGLKSFLRFSPKLYIAAYVIQFIVLAIALVRILSKNQQKRYNENFKFEQALNAWKPYFNHLKLRFQYFGTHRFRTCRGCGEFLRLKKGRGKRKIVCPKCSRENTFHFMF